jgi:acyl-CoA thioester hydrolase
VQETNKSPKPLEVELVLPVQTYDIDFAGHVSNIVYIRWLEDLRLKLLDEHCPLAKLFQQGYSPILAGTEIEYKRPIKLFDKVVGRMWINSLGRLKCTVKAEILANNQVAAVASQKGAFVSLENGRPLPIPEEIMHKYSQY